jgi:hypothetical protein
MCTCVRREGPISLLAVLHRRLQPHRSVRVPLGRPPEVFAGSSLAFGCMLKRCLLGPGALVLLLLRRPVVPSQELEADPTCAHQFEDRLCFLHEILECIFARWWRRVATGVETAGRADLDFPSPGVCPICRQASSSGYWHHDVPFLIRIHEQGRRNDARPDDGGQKNRAGQKPSRHGLTSLPFASLTTTTTVMTICEIASVNVR